jgi:hypothetical protein
MELLQRPHLLERPLVQRQPVEMDLAFAADQPHQRQPQRRLARSGLADDAKRLA